MARSNTRSIKAIGLVSLLAGLQASVSSFEATA